MEDLTSKITQMLGNPEMMSQIQNLMGSMGNNNNNNNYSRPTMNHPPNFEEDPSGNNNNNNTYTENDGFNADIVQNIMKFAPLLNSIKKEDKYSKFISSLKPLLSEKRQKKLDDASKILNIIKILPVLKSQGLF